ncbi:MAG TPA: hypothetical protein VE133_08695, partial [Candidatus Sulfotelmatobacter sp.]|nr:hypothetical protein [Candidatus Sulfotelmatobacter sp.]
MKNRFMKEVLIAWVVAWSLETAISGAGLAHGQSASTAFTAGTAAAVQQGKSASSSALDVRLPLLDKSVRFA